MALVWLVLARRSPETTYHLAPLLVAAAWGAARRAVGGGPAAARAGLAAGGGGMVVAAVTVAALAWLGALEGPTLWGSGSALAESLLFAAAGSVLSWRFVTRRRPGVLFSA